MSTPLTLEDIKISLEAFNLKIDGVEKRLEKVIGARIEEAEIHLEKVIDSRVGELAVFTKQGFDAMDLKFEAVDNRFDAMDRKFGGLETKFGGLEDQIDGLARITKEGFERVEGRLNRIETNVGTRRKRSPLARE